MQESIYVSRRTALQGRPCRPCSLPGWRSCLVRASYCLPVLIIQIQILRIHLFLRHTNLSILSSPGIIISQTEKLTTQEIPPGTRYLIIKKVLGNYILKVDNTIELLHNCISTICSGSNIHPGINLISTIWITLVSSEPFPPIYLVPAHCDAATCSLALVAFLSVSGE